MVAAPPTRTFVPATLDVTNFAELEILFRELLDRPLESASNAEQWLEDFSELFSVIYEYSARRYIDKSGHTDSPEFEKAYLFFVEQIEPKVKPLAFQLQRKLLESPAAGKLVGQRYQILLRNWRTEFELFREESIPLQTQIARLETDYNRIGGSLTAKFRGTQYTLEQLSRFLEEPERSTRQEAWEDIARRRIADRCVVEHVFDQMLQLRNSVARNSGLSDYRAYMWKSYGRFDYTPEDCVAFADAVAQTCVPIDRELDRQRREMLQLDRLRPWDFSVDPRHRPPLRPFDASNMNALIDGTKAIFSRLSPRFGEELEFLRARNNLDLESRKGKQPGGSMTWLAESCEPYIHMNATGMHADVTTLLHEGGHALHFLAARHEPLTFLRIAPVEFLEIASMGMEMFGHDHLDVFYDEADAARAKRNQLERIVWLLCSVAMIDLFQHWIYTHPGHTRDERTAEWLHLRERFGSQADWTGYEEVRASSWLWIPHLFNSPFYYIEYGIAQLGALQLWLKSRHDPHGALAGYRAALALGGTRTLPQLFAAAGISFDFSAKTLGPLMHAVQEELAQLPA